MDWYDKLIFSLIAIALVAIAIGTVAGDPVRAGLLDSAPTYGDFLRLQEIEDPDERAERQRELVLDLPLVKIYGPVNADQP